MVLGLWFERARAMFLLCDSFKRESRSQCKDRGGAIDFEQRKCVKSVIQSSHHQRICFALQQCSVMNACEPIMCFWSILPRCAPGGFQQKYKLSRIVFFKLVFPVRGKNRSIVRAAATRVLHMPNFLVSVIIVNILLNLIYWNLLIPISYQSLVINYLFLLTKRSSINNYHLSFDA